MKISNNEMLGFFVFVGAFRQRGMPARLSWKLTANDKILKPFGEAFDAATEDLRKRFAEKNEDGTCRMIKDENGKESYDITPENMALANAEMAELVQETFEAPVVELTLNDFPDTFEVSPEYMNLVLFLIDGNTADKKSKK